MNVMTRIKNNITLFLFLLILVVSIFLPSSTCAATNFLELHHRAQGATITEDYFLVADYSYSAAKDNDYESDSKETIIHRCNRNGIDISNCTELVKGHFKHANSLQYTWGTKHFWIFDGGCNPSTDNCGVGRRWCYSLNGKPADESKCGVKPENHSVDGYGLAQGFAQYGEYSLKGYSNPNTIVVYKNNKLVGAYEVEDQNKKHELEDIMVDGNTGEVYYIVDDWDVWLKKTSTVKLPKYSELSEAKKSVEAVPAIKSETNNTSKKTKTNGSTKKTKKTEKTETTDGGEKKKEETTTKPSTDYTTKKTETNTVTNKESDKRTVKTALFGEVTDDGSGCSIFKVLNLVVEIMSIGVGLLGVVGITITGIMYLTAGGNEQRTTKAKRRMFEIILGLAIYAVLWALVNWLLPGGMMNPTSC